MSQLTVENPDVQRTAAEDVTRLTTLLDLCWDAIIVTDLSDRITYWNQGAVRTYGWTRREAVGQLAPALFQTEGEFPLEEIFHASLRDGHWEGELRHTRKDGSRIVVLSRWTVQRNAQGQPSGWLKLNADITRRKRAESALDREREFSRRLIESSLDAISTFDRQLRYTLWNRAMEELTGIPRQEAIGRRVCDVLTFLKEIGEDNYFKAALKGKSLSSDDRPYWIPGSKRQGFFEARYSPIRENAGHADGNGRIIGGLVMMRDITDRRKNEEALRKLSARLLQIQDHERRRLARELHDGTTQTVTNIKLNLGGLRRLRLPKQAIDLLDETIVMAERAAQELRTTSYLLHPPELDVIGLAGAIRSFARGFSERTGIRTEVEISPNLRRLSQDVEIALFRILQESLANVHRHSQSPSTEIRLLSRDGYVVQEIRDFGRGMTSTEAAGAPNAPLGVGIAGMHARVRQLGGEMKIDSDSRGTVVRVKVPASSVPISDSGAEKLSKRAL
jgi:PAS domain S-box-containing protein